MMCIVKGYSDGMMCIVKGYSDGMRKARDVVYVWLGFLYVASQQMLFC
ncbi:MAG: hypothetical protein ACI3ZD_04390 [Prevotella sp.]